MAADSLGARAAQVLYSRRRNVESRWIQRVVTCEPYSLRPNLTLPSVLGQVGAIIDGLATALRTGIQPSPEAEERTLRQAVRRHAELRAGQGFRPEELVAEFRALRCEVWHVLKSELAEDGTSLQELFSLILTLDYALDTLLLGTIAAWRETPHATS